MNRGTSATMRRHIGGEGRLLGFLHVFIVGEGQAFELRVTACGCAVEAADFGADEFGEVGVFLLRHGAGAGGEGFRKGDEAELGSGEEGDLFGEAAEVQADVVSAWRYSRMKSRSLVASMLLAVGAVKSSSRAAMVRSSASVAPATAPEPSGQ